MLCWLDVLIQSGMRVIDLSLAPLKQGSALFFWPIVDCGETLPPVSLGSASDLGVGKLGPGFSAGWGFPLHSPPCHTTGRSL